MRSAYSYNHYSALLAQANGDRPFLPDADILDHDGARLVEVGTHDELMARGGQYAELYGIQAAGYR